MTATRSRRVLALAAAVVVVAGLIVTRASAAWADPAGDALYAAMVTLLVLLVAPRARAWAAGSIALGVCWLVELAQLTGVPAAVVGAVPAARYVLGTTFAPVDLAAYAAGVGLVLLADLGWARVRERAAVGAAPVTSSRTPPSSA